MRSLMVILESWDGQDGERVRDVFELTPPPAPGEERRVLVEVVRGIHPGAVEVAFTDGVAVLHADGRTITASFGPARAPAQTDPPPGQGTLFSP